MASHQLSTNAAHADAASADAIAATPADDAASSADAIAATLTAAKTGDLAALAAASDQNLRAVDAYGSNALHWAAGRGHLALVRHLVADRGMDASFPANPPRRRDASRSRAPAARPDSSPLEECSRGATSSTLSASSETLRAETSSSRRACPRTTLG